MIRRMEIHRTAIPMNRWRTGLYIRDSVRLLRLDLLPYSLRLACLLTPRLPLLHLFLLGLLPKSHPLDLLLPCLFVSHLFPPRLPFFFFLLFGLLPPALFPPSPWPQLQVGCYGPPTPLVPFALTRQTRFLHSAPQLVVHIDQRSARHVSSSISPMPFSQVVQPQ